MEKNKHFTFDKVPYVTHRSDGPPKTITIFKGASVGCSTSVISGLDLERSHHTPKGFVPVFNSNMPTEYWNEETLKEYDRVFGIKKKPRVSRKLKKKRKKQFEQLLLVVNSAVKRVTGIDNLFHDHK